MYALALYSFSGWYGSWYLNDVAIVKENIKSEYSNLFCKLGFQSKDDYIGNYPSNFISQSNTVKTYVSDSETNDVDDYVSGDTLNILLEVIALDSEYVENSLLCDLFERQPPFIVPTIDEIFSCNDDLSKLEYRHLWFCYDWIDDQ